MHCDFLKINDRNKQHCLGRIHICVLTYFNVFFKFVYGILFAIWWLLFELRITYFVQIIEWKQYLSEKCLYVVVVYQRCQYLFIVFGFDTNLKNFCLHFEIQVIIYKIGGTSLFYIFSKTKCRNASIHV